MNAKHSPAPWTPTDTNQDDTKIVIWSGEKPVCVVLGSSEDYGPDLECKANATLIAAAPDLLEALKTIIEDAGQFDSEMDKDSGEWYCRYCGTETTYIINKHSDCQNQKCGIVKARKAIAKAEGRD